MSVSTMPGRVHERVPVHPVSFPRVLRAEWIKLWSLRSTYWMVFATLTAMVALAILLGAASRVEGGGGPDGTMAIAIGTSFAQVVVAVLGALTMTGEYATGMVKSTMAAVPKRVPVLAAKALLVAGVGFALGVAGAASSYLASAPLFGDQTADLAQPEIQRLFWGSGLYLAGVAVFGLGIGTLLRHTAGALTVTLGILLMLSTVFQLLTMASDWFMTAYPYLPSTAGERIASPASGTLTGDGPDPLGPWEGYAVFMGYVTAVLVSAAMLLRRRDA